MNLLDTLVHVYAAKPECANFSFSVPNVTDVNYTDEILRDVVTRNLINSEVQLDLLGDSNQEMTLEQVLKSQSSATSYHLLSENIISSVKTFTLLTVL